MHFAAGGSFAIPSQLRQRPFFDGLETGHNKLSLPAIQMMTSEESSLAVADAPILPARFRLISLVGQGAMGTVYRAHDTQLSRDVAIKVLSLEQSSTVDGNRRFLREARTLATLRHPNILRIHAFGFIEATGQPYQVSDLLEGESLQQYLRREKALSLEQFRILARGLLSALEFASARHIVHRDIKPSNVFLSSDDNGIFNPILLDFGIAAVAQSTEDMKLTSTETILGSPSYMSPEQCRGEKTLTYHSDIYSLGCVLFECLTGEQPYSASSVAEVMFMHLSADVPPLSCYVDGRAVESKLSALVSNCMQKEPQLRPQSLARLADELIRSVDEVPRNAVFTSRPLVEKKRTRSRLLVMAAGAGVVLLSYLAVMYGQHLTHKNMDVFTSSTRNNAADIQTARLEDEVNRLSVSFEALKYGEEKEQLGRRLSKELIRLHDTYWADKRYDLGIKQLRRARALGAHFANSQHRTAELYFTGYAQLRTLSLDSKLSKSERARWKDEAMKELEAAKVYASQAKSMLVSVSVGNTQCLEYAVRGEMRAAKMVFHETWKTDRPDSVLAQDSFMFGDWRIRSLSVLANNLELGRYESVDDSLCFCELLTWLCVRCEPERASQMVRPKKRVRNIISALQNAEPPLSPQNVARLQKISEQISRLR